MPLIIRFTLQDYFNSSYPKGNFDGNQLLDGSMSLSPLYPVLISDLHVSTNGRSSTRVSSGFYQPRYSSPSFGSQRKCSHSPCICKRWALYTATIYMIKSQNKTYSHAIHVNSAILDKFTSNTSMHAELLGPCFKTGRGWAPVSSNQQVDGLR